MTNYRRAIFCGGYYFFTVLTYKRRPFLVDTLSRDCLRTAWQNVQREKPFEVTALCLLPEHIHCVWLLPEGDNDYSGRWAAIKSGFTRDYLRGGGKEISQSESRKQNGSEGYGKDDSGNIKYEMNRICNGTSIIFITAPLSTNWLSRLKIGTGQPIISLCDLVCINIRY